MIIMMKRSYRNNRHQYLSCISYINRFMNNYLITGYADPCDHFSNNVIHTSECKGYI